MIKEDMKFIGYRAFYNNRKRLKQKYVKLNRDDKIIYKYYVYSRRQLRDYTCDLIWRFLNDNGEDEEFIVTTQMLKDECYKYRM